MDTNRSVDVGSWEAKYQELLLSFEREQARVGQLYEAIGTRDVIGQAKGVLMERHQISADQAVRLLIDVSNRTNTRLYEVARELAATGVLIGVGPHDVKG
jgi:AmiR/NasT family two-component response regulator